MLYVLDEPSIGLHQRDNDKLIATMKRLRDLGNTLIVVEHDEDTMRQADYIVDVGPGAGVHGGEIVAAGSVADICKVKRSITGAYLSGRNMWRCLNPPSRQREIPAGGQSPREQPAGHYCGFPAGQDDLRDRRVRFRQIHAGQ